MQPRALRGADAHMRRPGEQTAGGTGPRWAVTHTPPASPPWVSRSLRPEAGAQSCSSKCWPEESGWPPARPPAKGPSPLSRSPPPQPDRSWVCRAPAAVLSTGDAPAPHPATGRAPCQGAGPGPQRGSARSSARACAAGASLCGALGAAPAGNVCLRAGAVLPQNWRP